jgi:hypothetical protein
MPMPTELPRQLLEVKYYQAAQAYLRSLPLEHFMEATPQATQREITLESLALVQAQRSEVQVFNELLVQYPLPRRRRPGQVVADNMVGLHSQPIKAEGSYDVPLQPVGPLWVLEYVSKSSKRKDYDESFRKYEQELKVPYYLLFVPESQEMTLYHHTGEKYVSIKPNEAGRHALPELELEMALLDGWVRFWFRGDLLPLPADLLHQLDDMRHQLREAQRRAEVERRGRLSAEAELARLRAEVAALKQNRPGAG